MAFRALLFSKSPDTNSAMTAACESTGIRAEVCSDIFTAIEKGKTRAFSCVIVDWADQPEASFLLKRARESTPNRNTLAIAIVDNEPTAAEMSENRLTSLIYRPISVAEANEVLAKAAETMQPSSAADLAESAADDRASDATAKEVSHSQESPTPQKAQQNSQDTSAGSGSDDPSDNSSDNNDALENEGGVFDDQARAQGHAVGMREVSALVLVLVAGFFIWNARGAVTYLAHTPEGGFHVLKESMAALFYMNQSSALPVGAAGNDSQQDAYFSRGSASSDTQTLALGVAASESDLAEAHFPLPKPSDFPLPVPVFERPVVPPVHVERAAIPESMRNSPPVERPLVVTVSPSQMMPVSASQSQPMMQQTSEPVALSEAAARAMLLHRVDPVYPAEAVAQKLQGPVVLQALVGRDGAVEDLKIVRGYFVLGKAAIAAVKQWRFQPYNLNGHAAATQTVITINFSYPPG
jgi:TonB family protein